ncbi:carbonic anhydrase [Streptomyces canus]|uniref:carbonic anhydrase n=1 Tax=Streptomyces canus TaxID=58343 RepID=UPI003F4C1724
MQYLIDQVRVLRARAALHTLHLAGLTQHHRPRAMLISCSDARIVPALLSAARPANLFELRTYGGVIPPYDTKTPDRRVQDDRVRGRRAGRLRHHRLRPLALRRRHRGDARQPSASRSPTTIRPR